MGKFLAAPTCFQMKLIGKVVSPLKPGDPDQLDNIWKEIGMRVFRVVLCTILTFNIPLAVIGLGLQKLAFFSSKKFALISTDNEPVNNIAVKKLTICTFNAYLMPNWIKLFVHNYVAPQQRVYNVVQGALDSDADILCMQEMFDNKTVFKFMELIKEKYPYIIYHTGSSLVKLGSGLLIASKFPIENPEYWEHSTKVGTEWLASKGTIGVTIRLNNNQRIPVFNTHLEAGLDDPVAGVACRVSQLQDIQTYLKEYCKKYALYFLCGDLNIPSRAESCDSIKLKEIISVNSQDAARIRGTYHKILPGIHENGPCNCLDNIDENQDIDYIAIPKPVEANAKLMDSRLACFNGASDHMASIATFDLSHTY